MAAVKALSTLIGDCGPLIVPVLSYVSLNFIFPVCVGEISSIALLVVPKSHFVPVATVFLKNYKHLIYTLAYSLLLSGNASSFPNSAL